MTKFKIENIFPGVDENGNDVLKFKLDGRNVSERIEGDYSIRKDETSDLVQEWKIDAADAKAINTELEAWAEKNKDTRFSRASDNSLVENVEYGIRSSTDGVVVFLNKEGEKALNIEGGYSLTSGAVVEYDSPEFGSQGYDNSTVQHSNRVKQAFYETPESLISDIQNRHEQFREEAKEAQEAELAGKPEHYVLRWNSEDGQSEMSGGEYRSKAEALAAIDEVKQNMIDAGTSDEDTAGIEAGSFDVTYVGPSEFVSNIRVDNNEGKLFAWFDVKHIDENGDETDYSVGDWIDLDDGLLVEGAGHPYRESGSNLWYNRSDFDFDIDEVMGQVNDHLRQNPISEKTLETYRADAEAAKANEESERERYVAS